MLVLGFKFGEKVFIGDDIQIEIVSLSAGNVDLGITAPKDIPILREKVKEQIDGEGNFSFRSTRRGRGF